MERFVQLIVAGGLALVAGLWMVSLLRQGSPPWVAGLGLATAGVLALGAGIWLEVEWTPRA